MADNEKPIDHKKQTVEWLYAQESLPKEIRQQVDAVWEISEYVKNERVRIPATFEARPEWDHVKGKKLCKVSYLVGRVEESLRWFLEYGRTHPTASDRDRFEYVEMKIAESFVREKALFAEVADSAHDNPRAKALLSKGAMQNHKGRITAAYLLTQDLLRNALVAMHEKHPLVKDYQLLLLAMKHIRDAQSQLEEELSGENQGKQTGDVVEEESAEGNGPVPQDCETPKKIDWKDQAVSVLVKQVKLMEEGNPVAVTSMSKLAQQVGVHKGTVSREIKNNPDGLVARVWKGFEFGRMGDGDSILDGYKDDDGNMEGWRKKYPIEHEEDPTDIENAKE